MTTNAKLAERLLSIHMRHRGNPQEAPSCFIGFDGFVDEIIDVVDTRYDSGRYFPMETIADFGARVGAAAGKSCNLELVVQYKKIGGNAPIMTNALLEVDGCHRITFAGCIGHSGQVEPLFQEMAARCERTIPLCSSAHSDALEFSDGKVILGKHKSLVDVTYEALLTALPKSELTALLGRVDLFASVNWTMLPNMTNVWHRLVKEIFPVLPPRREGQARWFFVDLADPAKRTDNDLIDALEILSEMAATHDVILGVNEAEGVRVAQVLGIDAQVDTSVDLVQLAVGIREKLNIHQVVIHATGLATTASVEGSFSVEGPSFAKPKLTTGAGDNFNAGYCHGLLCRLSIEESLKTAVATSGFYVREARSPKIEELATFIATGW